MTLLEYMAWHLEHSRRQDSPAATYIRKIFEKKDELEALPTSDDVYDHLFFRANYYERNIIRQITSAYRKYCKNNDMIPDEITTRRNVIY